MKSSNTLLLALIGLTSVAGASALETLDSLNRNYLGLNITGSAKAGFLQSKVKGSDIPTTTPTTENQANTEFNLDFNAHPSEFVQGLVRLRFHKDWNQAYDEGFQQPMPIWWNLKAQDPSGFFKIQAGDLLLKGSKLSMWSQDIDPMAFESFMLAERRKEAMSYHQLDGSSRHIQGAQSSLGISKDQFGAEINFVGARLRNPWWNTAVVQFNNAKTEKWLVQPGFKLEAMGAFVSVDHSVMFDKVRASRGMNQFSNNLKILSWNAPTDLEFVDRYRTMVEYENNTVTNLALGYKYGDAKSPLKASVRLDYAMSKYELNRDFFVFFTGTDNRSPINRWVLNPTIRNAAPTGADGLADFTVPRTTVTPTTYAELVNAYSWVNSSPDSMALYTSEGGPALTEDGSAMLAEIDVSYDIEGGHQALMNFKYLNNNEKFVSDLAQSQSFNAYQSSILNSKAGLGSASLMEGLYFYSWQMNPVTRASNLESNNPLDEKPYQGTNNHYIVPFEKSAWTGESSTRNERVGGLSILQVIYPQGYATPNRTGLDLNVGGSALDSAISVKVQFAQMAQVKKEVGNKELEKYSKIGVGVQADVSKLIGIEKQPMKLGVGYEMPKAEKLGATGTGKVDGTIISAGLDLAVIPSVSLLGAYQTVETKSGNNTLTEALMGGGLAWRPADAAELRFEYLMLNVKDVGPFQANPTSPVVQKETKIDRVIPRVSFQMAF
jgi:hypothetical protein